MKIDLRKAALEVDDDRVVRAEVQNLLDYGTDDPTLVIERAQDTYVSFEDTDVFFDSIREEDPDDLWVCQQAAKKQQEERERTLNAWLQGDIEAEQELEGVEVDWEEWRGEET
jgi:hypothetical protein